MSDFPPDRNFDSNGVAIRYVERGRRRATADSSGIAGALLVAPANPRRFGATDLLPADELTHG